MQLFREPYFSVIQYNFSILGCWDIFIYPKFGWCLL